MRDKLKVLLNIGVIYAAYDAYKATYRFCHKGWTAFKAMVFFIKWLMVKKPKLYAHLKKDYGVKNIKVWSPLRWKHKTAYLRGTIDDMEVFIKTPGEVNTTRREILALQAINDRSGFLKDHTPRLINKSDSDDILIEQIVQGKRMDRIDAWENEKDRKKVVEQLYEIYTELFEKNIIHMDIRPANFIISESNGEPKVILIDFGYALVDSKNPYEYIEENNNTKTIIKNLGSDYSLKNGSWDDAYSFLVTLKELEPSLMKDYNAIWKRLNNDIGINTVKI